MAKLKNNHFIIFQFPNKFLWIMIGAWLLSWFSKGLIFSISRTVFYIAGIIWAYEEIANGVNLFRRILGGVVLMVIGFGMLKAMM
jgi:hypothetical protein